MASTSLLQGEEMGSIPLLGTTWGCGGIGIHTTLSMLGL